VAHPLQLPGSTLPDIPPGATRTGTAMNRSAAVLLLTSLAMLVSACGTGAPLGDGKRGAAKAAFTAMRPASESDTGSSFNPLTAAGQPIDVSVATNVKGKQSGNASVKLDVSTDSIDNPSNVGVIKNIEFADFSDDGKTRYNGALRAELLVTTDGSSATVKYALKGRLTLSGEVDDVLDIDTTLDVAASAYDSASPSASVKLNGMIVTRSGRYDYANEAISIDVTGDLPADVSVNP
jgi:hypothetical protein